jgi:hypothetical protein
MSVPNTSNDAAAPLLVGDPPQDGADDEPSPGKHITIFKRTFNVMHLVFLGVGTLALVAIGVSIAAIGTNTLNVMLTTVLSVERRGDDYPKHGHRKSHAENVCLTPECVKLSADIIRSFGDADPCEDFYECSSV